MRAHPRDLKGAWLTTGVPFKNVPEKYWHQLNDGRILCGYCPRYCTPQEGQRGLSLVLARQHVLSQYSQRLIGREGCELSGWSIAAEGTRRLYGAACAGV